MPNKKISELTAAGALTGTELVEVVQSGANVQTTTQDIADLGGGGGGGVQSVTGDMVDNTDPDNPVLSFPSAAEVGADPAGTAAALLTSSIANGDTTHAPDANAVFDALALKLDSLTSFRTETASYTLDATDLAAINAGDNYKIKMNVASANNLTIPLNATQAFPTGTTITIHQIGAGQTTIVATGGVTINSENGWTKIQGQYASVVITKTATNTWDLEGTLAP